MDKSFYENMARQIDLIQRSLEKMKDAENRCLKCGELLKGGEEGICGNCAGEERGGDENIEMPDETAQDKQESWEWAQEHGASQDEKTGEWIV